MGDDMRQKEHLTVPLDQDLLERIQENRGAMRIPISDTISLAFDALEKKEKVSERSGKSGRKPRFSARCRETSGRENGRSEREREGEIEELLDSKMQAHDQAASKPIVPPRTF